MKKKEYLTNKIQDIRNLIAKYQQEPKSESIDAMLENKRQRLSELQKEFQIMLLEENYELFELRIIGDHFNGNININTASKIFDYFNKSINYAADKISNPKKINQANLNEIIGMRLEKISHGSCRLSISATPNDLITFNDTIESVFNVLNAETKESIYNEVKKIGYKSIHNLNHLLKTFIKNDATVDFKLKAYNTKYKWVSEKDKMALLESLITSVSEATISRQIEGHIIMLSKNGALTLENCELDEMFKIKFKPDEFHEAIIKLKIDDFIKITVEEKTKHHDLSANDEVSYQLVSIND